MMTAPTYPVFRWVQFHPTFEDWKRCAATQKVHPEVLRFLSRPKASKVGGDEELIERTRQWCFKNRRLRRLYGLLHRNTLP